MNDTSSTLIRDITENEFDEYVIQQSTHTLVLVDFWAGWCNPCKMLSPLLDNVIDAYGGDVLLAKVDTDKEKNLSAAFNVRSLPTVLLFKKGEIVDTFMGVIPEENIKSVIDSHRFNENDTLIEQAEIAFNENRLEEAEALVNKILQTDDSYLNATVMLAKIYLKQKKYDEAEHLLQHVQMNKLDHPLVVETLALIRFYREVPESETIDSLKTKTEQEDTVEQHYQLGCLYAIERNYELALEEFLQVLTRDKKFNDDGARKNMLAIFEMLGSAGPLVNLYRVKMARLLH